MGCEGIDRQHVKCCCSTRYGVAHWRGDVPSNNRRHGWSPLIDRKSHQASPQMRSERGDKQGSAHWRLHLWPRVKAFGPAGTPRHMAGETRGALKAPWLPCLLGETLQLEAVISSYVSFEEKHAFKCCASFKGFWVLSHYGPDKRGLGAMTTLRTGRRAFFCSTGH